MSEERKYPWTTAELFLKICENLKEKGLMPDILDYALSTSPQLKITTEEFCLRNNLDYGGSEGIYLDVYVEFKDEDGEMETKGLGTFKTLSASDEAMHIMANLLADFIIELNGFVNNNLDDFNWQGFDVLPYVEDGKRERWSLTCRSRERAEQKKAELLEKYPIVEVRDNSTRKKVVYRRKNSE